MHHKRAHSKTQKNNYELNKQFQSTTKKHKKIISKISEKNMKNSNQKIDINSNNNNHNLYNNSTIKYNMNEIYNKSNIDFPILIPKDEDLNKSSISEKKLVQKKIIIFFLMSI